jgi:NADPH-dependent ferric siderophore reductase
MGERPGRPRSVRTRREPPPFKRVTVVRIARPSPWLVSVTLDGPGLDDLIVDEPAASVRLLLPSSPGEELVIPEWNGNEFLLADGRRPILRTFTPIRPNGSSSELTLDIVRHDGGAASDWAAEGVPGLEAAISGPGRGYTPDPEASSFLLTGDESAVPAIGQLIAALATRWPVRAGIEVRSGEAAGDRLADTAADVEWRVLDDGALPGTAQHAYVREARIEPGTRIWAAGEAAAMQRIRRHLFDERGIDRSDTMVRGYWKRNRSHPVPG